MRELKPKPFVVTDPSGTEHIAYAKTQASAITDVQASLREKWSARLATGEDMYLAAREGRPVLNAPPSISSAPGQADAFVDFL